MLCCFVSFSLLLILCCLLSSIALCDDFMGPSPVFLCLLKLALQSLDRPGPYTLSACVLLVFVSMPMLPRTNFISSCTDASPLNVW